MPYWVYGLRSPPSAGPLGLQSAQPRPADPLFLEADSEEAARAQAQEMGMIVESVEFVAPTSSSASAPRSTGEASAAGRRAQSNLLARWLVVVLRVLALLAALWGVVNTGVAIEAARTIGNRAKEMERIAPGAASAASSAAATAVFAAFVQGVALVAVLLALAEVLRLGISIHESLRGEQASPSRQKSKRRSG